MASAAVVSALEAEGLAEVDQILSVEIGLIDLGPRLRAVDELWALALGELMLREGQRDPVDIAQNPATSRFEVHGAGGHRWTGARAAGIEHLQVRVHAWNPDAARLREIADNLHRRDLDPFDRALFVAEAVTCLKRMKGIDPSKDGRAASANVRWQKQLAQDAADTTETFAVAYGWSAEVGAQIGLSERSVRDLLLLARRLPAQVARLRAVRHPILSNASQLRALAKLDDVEQGRVVDQLTAATPAKSVSEAVARLRGANRAPNDPAAKMLSAFIGNFSRMSLTEKKGALNDLRPHLPSGFALTEGAQPAGSLDALRAQVKAAMERTFDLLIRLDERASSDDAEPLPTDDIRDTRYAMQRALMGLNSGAAFLPGDDA